MIAGLKDNEKVNLIQKVICVRGYEDLLFFKNGVAEVKKDEKKGYINKQGIEIIPCEYDSSVQLNRSIEVTKNGSCALYDLKGNMIIPFKDYVIIAESAGGGFKAIHHIVNNDRVSDVRIDTYDENGKLKKVE